MGVIWWERMANLRQKACKPSIGSVYGAYLAGRFCLETRCSGLCSPFSCGILTVGLGERQHYGDCYTTYLQAHGCRTLVTVYYSDAEGQNKWLIKRRTDYLWSQAGSMTSILVVL